MKATDFKKLVASVKQAGRIRRGQLRPGRVTRFKPADVRTIVAKNVNGAALKAREDTEKLNANLQAELAGKGFLFNQPDLKPFREKLKQAGFYAEWKSKYGDEAWAILEKNAGKLT